jgi:hypothetical protein
MGSVNLNLQASAVRAEATIRQTQLSRTENSSTQRVQSDSVELNMQVEQLSMRLQRMNSLQGMQQASQLLIRRAQLNIDIDFKRIDRFIDNAEKLEDISPDLLKEYLAVIKLLDKNTPDKLDPFFDQIEKTLKNFSRDDQQFREKFESLFISFRIEVFQFSFSSEQQKGDPLIFDLDGDGIELSSAANGFDFDLNADGLLDRSATVTSDDMFLAMDRNGNGKIDNGRELFGDQNGARDGFAELRKLDDNQDNRIDNRDRDFKKLRLFNGHGLKNLDSAGITAISLVAQTVFQQINGNDIIATAEFERNDGSYGTVAEALLSYI